MLSDESFSKKDLYRSRPQDVVRLARWLGLRKNLGEMRHKQRCELVWWRITRKTQRLRGLVA